MISKLYYIFLVFSLYACVSTKNTHNQIAYETNTLNKKKISSKKIDKTGIYEENLEKNSNLFCHDDTIATFLKKNFLSERGHENISDAKLKNKFRKKSKNEIAARYFVRQQLEPIDSLQLISGLPLEYNAEVEQWIHYFTTLGRESFLRWLIRAESLREIIQEELVSANMPEELFYLAMIESGLSAHAFSRARATGTWQFMLGTGKMFDLKVNYWVDERRDPIKSTVAAASYLRELYQRFNSWYLAFAAYNAGPGKIQRAINKTGTNNFWEIAKTNHIRAETKHYVPKFLAAFIVSSNAEKYGFSVARNPELDLATDDFLLVNSYKLDDIANVLGVEINKLKSWNPELLRNVTPPASESKPYVLKVPSNYDTLEYLTLISGLEPVSIQDLKQHQVQRGDTLSGIARKYQTRVAVLKELNPELVKKTLLRAGQKILVPF